MSRTPAAIPNRAVYKPSEVCEIAQLQPFILRSWESEFPDLGVTKGSATGRLYRRSDLDRVLRIKHLLFVEGLTLAGVRRRFEEEQQPVGPAGPEASAAADEDLISKEVRERLDAVKRGLRSILEMLGPNGSREGESVATFELTAADAPQPAGSRGEAAPAVRDTPAVGADAPVGVPARRKRAGSQGRKR